MRNQYIICANPKCVWRHYNSCQWYKCPYGKAFPIAFKTMEERENDTKRISKPVSNT